MPERDIEQRLGDLVRRRAESFEPSPDLRARIGERTRRRQQHRQLVAGGVLAAVVLVGVAVPLALRDTDSQQVATSAATDPRDTDADAGAGAERAEEAVVPVAASAAPTAASSRAADAGDAAEGAPVPAAATAATAATSTPATTVAAAPSTTAAPATAGPVTTTAPVAPRPPPVTTGPGTTAGPGPGSPEAIAGRPPYFLAVPAGDTRVAFIETATGAVVRSVEDAVPATGVIQYDELGQTVFRVGGCGVVPTSVAAGSGGPTPLVEQQDATALTVSGTGTLAWARPADCANPTAGALLTIGAAASARTLPVAGPVSELTFSPDGTMLVGVTGDGLTLLDVADPASTPVALPAVDLQPACPTAHPAFVPGTPTVMAVRQCPDGPPLIVTYDVTNPFRPPTSQMSPVPGLRQIDALDFDPSGRFWLLAGRGADGTSAVYVFGNGSGLVTIPGARSSHWTSATP